MPVSERYVIWCSYSWSTQVSGSLKYLSARMKYLESSPDVAHHQMLHSAPGKLGTIFFRSAQYVKGLREGKDLCRWHNPISAPSWVSALSVNSCQGFLCKTDVLKALGAPGEQPPHFGIRELFSWGRRKKTTPLGEVHCSQCNQNHKQFKYSCTLPRKLTGQPRVYQDPDKINLQPAEFLSL